MTRLFALTILLMMIAPALALAQTTIPEAKPAPYKYAPVKVCDWKADTLSSFGACTGDGDKSPTKLRSTSRGLELPPSAKAKKPSPSGYSSY